ncbi:MAG: GFA family protein [Thermodesulfobacteriota bacterium]
MSNEKTYTGSCFCGEIEFTVTGEPAGMGYCHCVSCRHWSAGPVNAFTLWRPETVKVTKGENNIGTYNKTPGSSRKWCKTCGGHIFMNNPTMGLVNVYAAVIPELTFTPGVHVHYQETVLPIKDGLPKFRDLPKEAGGTGEEVPE